MTNPIPKSELVNVEWKDCTECKGTKNVSFGIYEGEHHLYKCKHCSGSGVEPVLVENEDTGIRQFTNEGEKTVWKLQIGVPFEICKTCGGGHRKSFGDMVMLKFLPIRPVNARIDVRHPSAKPLGEGDLSKVWVVKV